MYYLIKNINEVDDKELKNMKLTKEQIKRAKTKETLVSYYILEILLKNYGLHLKDIYYENNKPLNDKIYVSVSHKNGYVICATDYNPIGIDIEKITCFNDSIIDNFFSINEKNYILNKCDKNRNFFKIYTIKEAISKISGIGIKQFKNYKIKFFEHDGYIISIVINYKKEI